MASNALSFEQIREMQRQNKFKRQAKMEEISKSSEYRNVKTTLTEKHNEVRALITTHYTVCILTLPGTIDSSGKSQVKRRT